MKGNRMLGGFSALEIGMWNTWNAALSPTLKERADNLLSAECHLLSLPPIISFLKLQCSRIKQWHKPGGNRGGFLPPPSYSSSNKRLYQEPRERIQESLQSSKNIFNIKTQLLECPTLTERQQSLEPASSLNTIMKMPWLKGTTLTCVFLWVTVKKVAVSFLFTPPLHICHSGKRYPFSREQTGYTEWDGSFPH